MDFTVSFAAMAGVTLPPGRSFDGIDVLRHLAEGREPAPRTLFWRMRRGNLTRWAVIDGDIEARTREIGSERRKLLFDFGGRSRRNTRPRGVRGLRRRRRLWRACRMGAARQTDAVVGRLAARGTTS
jgi:hypothetical protein